MRLESVLYCIREMKSSEVSFLEDFLYEAVFQRPGDDPLPGEIIYEPQIYSYIRDFDCDKPSDLCLVAETDGKIVGAVWTRILNGEVKGFGNVDEKTPEFAISLYKEYRGMGIGTDLMKSMLNLLKQRGYERASLAVQKDNYALKMYQKVGFTIFKELEEEYLMLCELGSV